jgi:hypothetical protein
MNETMTSPNANSVHVAHPSSRARSASALMIAAVFLLCALPAEAQIALGTAQNYGVLGGSTVTNTGPTTVNGDVGVSPGSSVTGFPPGIVTNGSIHAADAAAAQAQSDLTVAYNAAAGTPCNTDLTGQDLGVLPTLTPGVYCFDSSAFLTGTVTLDFQGNANALFLFKIGSTLVTASGSSVLLINNAGNSCPPNLFWQVGSSATFGTNSTFVGNVLALTSITLTTAARLDGKALARNGAVTLDSNVVGVCSIVGCPVITVSPATLPGGAVGVAYNQTVTASGGAGPFVFAVTSGTLPTGLSLNPATGAITGTPSVMGTFSFTITATSPPACTGSRAYTVGIGVGAGQGAPTLDFWAMATLVVLLAVAGLFVMNKFSI